MTKHARNEVACHLCFNDKTLQDWIKEQDTKRDSCPWCGRNGYLVPLELLGEPFREVVNNLYIPVDDSGFEGAGDQLGFLLGDNWNLFADVIEEQGLAQELAVSILQAGLRSKALYDHPDYEGWFRHRPLSLEDSWDERVYSVLRGNPQRTEDALIGGIDNTLSVPDQMEVAFEDLATTYHVGKTLYRARVHKDRTHIKRFGPEDLGAPPPEFATAGRANRKGQPVLYLASSKSTALAEVRPWKGAAVAIGAARLARVLSLVDLSRAPPMRSPFFAELLRWNVELEGLLYRLGEDMSRPVMPHEEDVLYRPTQLLAQLIRSNGYDGCIYPSAMGGGTNIVLFNPLDAEIENVDYFRVKRAAYFSAPFAPYEAAYDEGPYDYALTRGR